MSIELRELSYDYQPNSPFASQALFDISLSIEENQFIALIGHTGSGKSTLIQHLNGLLVPTKGSVLVEDFLITPKSKQKEIHEIRKKVGLVFQFPEAQLFEETVLKDVAFGPQNFGVSQEEAEKAAREKLKLVGLDSELFEHSPFELSGGQMRRVAIAGILAMNPEVLVLDEPAAGLDPKSRVEMMNLFEKLHQTQGLTVILVTHNMDDVANYADFVYILEKGRQIKSGKPSEIFQMVDFVREHKLGLPRAAEFALKLREKGLPFEKLPVTKEELVAQLVQFKMLKEARNG